MNALNSLFRQERVGYFLNGEGACACIQMSMMSIASSCTKD